MRSLSAKLTTATQNTATKSDISALQSRLDKQIDRLDTRISENIAEAQSSSASATASEISSTALEAVKQSVGKLTVSLSAQTSSLSNLQEKVSQIESSKVSASDLTALEKQLDAQISTYADATSVSLMRSNITRLQATQRHTDEDLSKLSVAIDKLGEQVAAFDKSKASADDVTELIRGYDLAQRTLKSLQTTLSSNAESLAATQKLYGNLSTSLQDLAAELSALKSAWETHTSDANADGSILASAQAQVEQLQQQIADATEQLAAVDPTPSGETLGTQLTSLIGAYDAQKQQLSDITEQLAAVEPMPSGESLGAQLTSLIETHDAQKQQIAEDQVTLEDKNTKLLTIGNFIGLSELGSSAFDNIVYNVTITYPNSVVDTINCDAVIAGTSETRGKLTYKKNLGTYRTCSLPATDYVSRSCCYGKGNDGVYRLVTLGAEVWSGSTADTNKGFYSEDSGQTWTSFFTPESAEWRSVCYGEDSNGVGHFFAYNGSSTIYSKDGKTWDRLRGPGSSIVIYCGNKFIQAHHYPTGTVTYYGCDSSEDITDNSNWHQIGEVTLSSSSSFYFPSYDTPWCYGECEDGVARFVAIRSNSSYEGFYSEDGVIWKNIKKGNGSSSSTSTYSGRCICCGKDQNGISKFIGIGSYNSSSYNSSSYVYFINGTSISADSDRMQSTTGGYIGDRGYMSVCYGLDKDGVGKFVAVGDKYAAYSEDGGEHWTEVKLSETDIFTSVCYANGRFVAIAYRSTSSSSSYGSDKVMYSLDGATWTETYGTEGSSALSFVQKGTIDIVTAGAGTLTFTEGVSGVTEYNLGASAITTIAPMNLTGNSIKYTVTEGMRTTRASMSYGDGVKTAIVQLAGNNASISDGTLTCSANAEIVSEELLGNENGSSGSSSETTNPDTTVTQGENPVGEEEEEEKEIIEPRNITDIINCSAVIAGTSETRGKLTYKKNLGTYRTCSLPVTDYASLSCCYGKGSDGVYRLITLGAGVSSDSYSSSITGTNKGFYSEDNGQTWASFSTPEPAEWRSVRYGEDSNGVGHFFAYDIYSTSYSKDGKTWNRLRGPGSSIAIYGSNKFIQAYPDSYYNRVTYYGCDSSEDVTNSSNWHQIGEVTSSSSFYFPAYDTPWCYGECEDGVSRFVAINTTSSNGNQGIYYSEDGVIWKNGSPISSPSSSISSGFCKSICCGKDQNGISKFIGVGSYESSPYIFSSNGTNIGDDSGPMQSTTGDYIRDRWYMSVCYGLDKDGVGKFVAVDQGGYAAYSEDGGKHWTEVKISETDAFFSVCYANGRFVAIAYGKLSSSSAGSDKVMYSLDGATWTEKYGTEGSSALSFVQKGTIDIVTAGAGTLTFTKGVRGTKEFEVGATAKTTVEEANLSGSSLEYTLTPGVKTTKASLTYVK